MIFIIIRAVRQQRRAQIFLEETSTGDKRASDLETFHLFPPISCHRAARGVASVWDAALLVRRAGPTGGGQGIIMISTLVDGQTSGRARPLERVPARQANVFVRLLRLERANRTRTTSKLIPTIDSLVGTRGSAHTSRRGGRPHFLNIQMSAEKKEEAYNSQDKGTSTSTRTARVGWSLRRQSQTRGQASVLVRP